MLRSLLRDERATVTVVIAAMMLIILAMAGFAFDFGRFYLSQSRDQLAADMAASAAAVAFAATNSETTAATQACVSAAMNGVNVTCSSPSQTTVTTTFGPPPTGSSDTGIHVVVSTKLTYSPFSALFSAIGQNNTLPVKAGAWAQVTSGSPPCLVALSPSTNSTPAINLSGSASVAAAGCSVQAGGPISVSGTGSVGTTSSKAQSVATGSTIEYSGSGAVDSVTTPKQNYSFPGANPDAPSDPYASSSTVTADFSRLTSTVENYSAASNSVPSASTSSTDYNQSCTSGNTVTITGKAYRNVALSGSGCTFSIDTTASFSVSGTLSIGDYSNGSINVVFPNNSTYDINQIVNGAVPGFGAVIQTNGSTFNITNGVSSSNWAAQLSFGCSGAFTATVSGQSYLGCSGSDPDTNTYKIKGGVSTGGDSIVFGNGEFEISGGVTIGNGAACAASTVGSKTVESGNAIGFGNGTNFIVTDTGISIGGGCFTFGNATNHDINGGGASNYAINDSSGTTILTFGTGTYTLNGGLILAGASTSSGTGMSLVMSGNLNLTAGANNVTWSAPASAPYLILTNSTAGGNGSTSGTTAIGLSGAATTVLSGAIYAPNGGVYLTGSGEIDSNAPTGSCFSMAAQFITLDGGSAAASVCPNTGSSTGGTVALVQ